MTTGLRRVILAPARRAINGHTAARIQNCGQQMTIEPPHRSKHSMQPRRPPQGSIAQRILEENRQRKQDAAELAELFEVTLPEFMPDERQFLIWLRRYDKDIIAESIDRTAEWLINHAQRIEAALAEGRRVPAKLKEGKVLDDIIRYATKVMINKTAEANGHPGPQTSGDALPMPTPSTNEEIDYLDENRAFDFGFQEDPELD